MQCSLVPTIGEKPNPLQPKRDRNAQSGDLDDAGRFGDAIVHTVPDVLPSNLLREPHALSGKVLIDCSNSDVPSDFRFDVPIPSLAERLAPDVPLARVVKAFNAVAAQVYRA
ncbi:MAG: hypothetical protein ACR2NN_03830 [Bryobacteraceae bacterium]